MQKMNKEDLLVLFLIGTASMILMAWQITKMGLGIALIPWAVLSLGIAWFLASRPMILKNITGKNPGLSTVYGGLGAILASFAVNIVLILIYLFQRFF